MISATAADSIASHYRLIAPLAPDGSFELAGVPTSRVEINLEVSRFHYGEDVTSKLVPAGTADVTGYALAVPTQGRAIDVIVRSELPVALDIAQVLIVPGKVKMTVVGDLMKRVGEGVQNKFAHAIVGEQVPEAIAGKVRPGDMLAHFDTAPLGDITVCALGLNADMRDHVAMSKIQEHIGEVAIRCQVLAPEVSVVTLEAPPQKRFE